MNKSFAIFILISFIALMANIETASGSSAIVAKAYAANATIEMISIGIEMFKVDTGRYPTDNEGILILATKPLSKEVANWKGPYLYNGKIPLDPWGNSFVYKSPGVFNKKSFDLFSAGADGVSKTNGNDEDDINNWQDDAIWQEFYSPRTSLMPRSIFGAIVFCVAALMIARNYKRKRT